MPSIDLARLKKQSVSLTDLFGRPEIFVHELLEFLDYYVNRTLRSADSVAPGSVLPTYRTPKVVLKHLENELSPAAIEEPEKTLDLADELWDAGFLETRLLAAFLLGQIPPQEELLLARLTAWTQQVRDPNVRASLLSTSLERLRKETPERFLTLIGEWLHPARPRHWSNGIRALIPLINDPHYDNLPPVLEIITSAFEEAPVTIQADLEALILSLHNKSPQETEYFLQQILAQSKNPQTAISLRRIFPKLPKSLRDELDVLLREKY
ncbi:MAG: DNA alkylation repair protein [Anaerolineales bacterium]|nr:DNA alkylation repair protein [Anaerolineales bacterium]